VLVIADEVHGDLIMRGHTYTPFASLGDDFRQHSITCVAPSKSFNLAGMSTSNIVIPDADLRARYRASMANSAVHGASMFGMVALEAAYNHGEEWLEQALDYITGNAELLGDYLAENIPQIKLVPLEGTYLAWLDCRGLGLDAKTLRSLMVNDARVYMDEGVIFGPEGEGFERINLACPRPLLAEALERIRDAVAHLEETRAGS
jgi:cystathionine beta-lyase